MVYRVVCQGLNPTTLEVLDEFADMSDTAQLCIFIHIVFIDWTGKEEAASNAANERTHVRRGHFLVSKNSIEIC